MTGYYDHGLVAFSLLVAIIASYTALDLAGCVSTSTSTPRKSWIWLGAGAVSMGTGIWSMHFIGMLAFRLPIAVAFDLPLSLLSLLAAIGVSAIALLVLRRSTMGAGNLTIGATLMGLGISTMHYTGMFAMRMSPPIHYDPLLVTASVLIAIGASFAALWLAFQLRRLRSKWVIPAKLASAAIMGLAITGMHYTGMAAAHFVPGSVCIAARSGSMDSTILAIAIGGTTLTILCLTLIVSALDAHFAMNNARLAAALDKITRELQETQDNLVTAARNAGMAEIANNVLHNVGNVLTSVNVSARLIDSKLRDSKTQSLAKAVQLMNDHASDMGHFMTEDKKGKMLPAYLKDLAVTLAEERAAMADELARLTNSVDHIKDIVANQRSYSGSTTLLESVQVKDLLEDALRMQASSILRHEVAVVKDFAKVPAVLLDKHLILQILVNLIGNATHAMDGVLDRARQMTLRLIVAETLDAPRLRISVEDNGVGIAPENLVRLFVHGFTTRKEGHGFGLHSCALAAKQMNGKITAASDGPGKGAAFTLELPMRTPVYQS